MKYSDNFDEYYYLLLEMIYTGPQVLEELKIMIEGIIGVMELKSETDEQFIKSTNHYKMQFKIDLDIVIRAICKKSLNERESGFYNAKSNLKDDLKNAASAFRFHGF
jgi:hypothetical protein